MNVKVLPLRAFQYATHLFNGKAVFGRKLGDIPVIEFFYESIRRGLIPKDVTTQINGYKIKTNFSMGGIARLIVEQGEYEHLTTGLFIERVKVGRGAVIDVGANIGYYTLLAATILRDSGDNSVVYAFEPEAGNQIILRENINLNHLVNVKAFPLALSDKDGRSLLYTSEIESGEHNIIGSHGLSKATAYEVTTQKLDSIWFSGHATAIRLIKIDVEGAEVMVLRGAERVLQEYHPALFVECWQEGLAKAGSSVDELLFLLLSHGYSVSMIDEFSNAVRPASVDSIRQYDFDHHFSVNLLCEHNG